MNGAVQVADEPQTTERPRNAGGGKFFRQSAPGNSRPSEDQIAIRALQAYHGGAKSPNVYNKLKGYAGGNLYLIEFTGPDGGDEYWSVLVRKGEVQVFYDHEMAFRESVTWTRRISSLTFGGLITAMISIGIVGAFLYFAIFRAPVDAPQSLNYALSSVLGFWFGKSVTPARRDQENEG